MRALRTAFGLAAIASGACSDMGTSFHASVAPSLLFPRGLLDNVQSLKLTIYDATNGIDCDATSGKAIGIAGATPIASPPPLASTGCTSPAKFCGSLDLSQSATPRVFAAVATGANNTEIADGCAKTTVNQEQLSVAITMMRFVQPAVCGDMIVEATEQCDPPGNASDVVCDGACHTKEEWLSNGSTTTNASTVNGGVGEKTRPRLTWPAQSGIGGRLISAFGDSASSTHLTHVAMRLMSDSLETTSPSEDPGMEASSASFFIPNDSSTTHFPPFAETGNQSWPTVVASGGEYFLAYQDDSLGIANGLDVHLRSMSATTLHADQPMGQPVVINGVMPPDGWPGAQGQAAMDVGPNGAIFIAYQSTSSGPQADGTLPAGQILGRLFTPMDPSWKNLPEVEISSGVNNQHAAVAGTPNGWIVVWESGTDVMLAQIRGDGSTSGQPVKVNTALHHGLQDHPSVAVTGDGRFAVVWADHGASGGTDIFVQRYASSAVAVVGDQDLAINNVLAEGEQVTPSIAAGSPASGMFAVTWLDQGSNHVRARLLAGTTGFLFNNVDGKDDEFQASVVDGHPRANPTIAVGGVGQYVAIGWEDLDPSQPGVFVRRFPVPQ